MASPADNYLGLTMANTWWRLQWPHPGLTCWQTPMVLPWPHLLTNPKASPTPHLLTTLLASLWSHLLTTTKASPWPHLMTTPMVPTLATPTNSGRLPTLPQSITLFLKWVLFPRAIALKIFIKCLFSSDILHIHFKSRHCTMYSIKMLFTFQLTGPDSCTVAYSVSQSTSLTLSVNNIFFWRDTLSLVKNVNGRDISLAIDREGQEQNRSSRKYLSESRNLFLLLQRYPLFSWKC